MPKNFTDALFKVPDQMIHLTFYKLIIHHFMVYFLG